MTNSLAVNGWRKSLVTAKSESDGLVEKQSDGANASSQIYSAGDKANRSVAKAIIFVKMIKVGGESFGTLLLSQYARKRGWRTLQHKDCSETRNPLGHATCACTRHFIGGSVDMPPKPNSSELPYSVLYTHMHYNPKLMEEYFPSGATRLVILRDPFAVLQSMHVMAAFQAKYEPTIKDNFCQDLAADGDAWRAKCPIVHNGRDSIMDYLDEEANSRLLELFVTNISADERHSQALAIIENVTKRLEDDFIVGLQEEYDASMLLFEAALGWNRNDSLYYKDTSAHRYSDKYIEVKNARDSWHNGTRRGQEIMDEFNRGPYFYYNMLYQRGVEVHKKQLEQMLGTKSDVKAAVALYRKQNMAFSNCMKLTCKGCWRNSCTTQGLELHAEARPRCAEEAEANVSWRY